MARQSNGRGRRRNESTDSLSAIVRLAELELSRVEQEIRARANLSVLNQREIEDEIRSADRMRRALGDPFKHGDDYRKEKMRIDIDRSMSLRKAERRADRVRTWKDLLELYQRKIQLQQQLATAGGSVQAEEEDDKK